jgi:hypothetical protein
MRTKLEGKPLSHCMKDPEVLKATLGEMVKIQKQKREEELLKDPKTKMFGLLLKAKRIKEEEAESK